MSQTAWVRAWDSYQHYLNTKAGGKDASRSKPEIVAMQPFTAHQIRHTYATMLYDAGVDLKIAQEKLGHSDVQTILGVYTHIAETRKMDSNDKLDEYFKKMMEKAI